jgi:hypothetical protein
MASIKCSPHCESGYESFNSDSWQAVENQLLFRPKPFKAKIYLGRGQDHPQSSTFQNGVKAIYDKHNFYGYNRSACLL